MVVRKLAPDDDDDSASAHNCKEEQDDLVISTKSHHHRLHRRKAYGVELRVTVAALPRLILPPFFSLWSHALRAISPLPSFDTLNMDELLSRTKGKSKLRASFEQRVAGQLAKMEADRNDIPTCRFVNTISFFGGLAVGKRKVLSRDLLHV